MPILYSTGCVEADNVTGAATGSQLAGMENLNTIRIASSTLTSTTDEGTAEESDEDEGGLFSWLQGIWGWITSLFS